MCPYNRDLNNRIIISKSSYRGSFLARTLASNFRPFLTTYSANLSMTGWMSGGGGMMAGAAGVETGASTFELFKGYLKMELKLCNTSFDFNKDIYLIMWSAQKNYLNKREFSFLNR